MAHIDPICTTIDKIEGRHFNASEGGFAIVPDRHGDPVDLQRTLEGLLHRHRETDDLDEKNEVVAELMEMHGQGLILWPVGAVFGRSALGDVNEQRFARSVLEHDPGLHDVRQVILDTEQFSEAKWSKREKASRSFALWKIVAALHFAGEDIEGLETVKEAHLVKMSLAFKENGKWKEWVPQWARKNIRQLADLIGAVRGDALFAVTVMKDARGNTQSLRLEDIVARKPHLKWLADAYEAWIDEQRVLTKDSHRDGLRLLLFHFMNKPTRAGVAEGDMDLEILTDKGLKPVLKHAERWSSPTAGINAVSKIQRFCEYMSDRTAETGERKALGFLESDLARYKAKRNAENPPASSSSHSEVRARPMPPRYHQMLREIVAENDFAWAKSLTSRVSGKPLHWITWSDPETGTTEPVFCEVLPRLLLAHLDLPLRNVQIRRLDSGEGDARAWDPVTGAWKKADGPHAGHWERVRAKNQRRGVIREIATLTGSVTGFYVNTNKTQDSRDSFDENSGYEIPWQHEDALRNFAQMREWQEKYNPVAGPIAHKDIPKGIFEDDPSAMVSRWLPDRFFLFRWPDNQMDRGNEMPPGYKAFHQFFHDALAELERRLKAEDPEFPVNIITKWAGDSPKAAIFTIHGMRSANLTALYMAGVPIEILSKVVAGHATILMTLKYTKFEPVHVNEILTKARVQAIAMAREDFPDLIKGASLEQAMQMTSYLMSDGVRQMKGAYDEPSIWSRFDIGICPNGGALCNVGGPPASEKAKRKVKHTPVPGGERNCVRCRFFVSGLPFLIPLWAHANAIFARIDRVARKMETTRRQTDALKEERRQLNAAGRDTPRQLGIRIRLLDETWTTDAATRDQFLADAEATMMLIEKIRFASGEQEEGESLPMLLPDSAMPEVVGRESTRFELVDSVVQASRWFPSISDAALEAERDGFLDRILFRNGYAPITMAPLAEDERRRAADALASLLLVELKAMETQNLIEGRKSLADFAGLQERLETAAGKAVGAPLQRLALPRAVPPTIDMASGEERA